MPENNSMDLCPSSKPRNLRKKEKKFTRQKVLKMLAVMEPQPPASEPVTSHSQEFLSTGRTGRRNALPDILSEHVAVVTSADLPARLQTLTTKDGAGTSQTADTTTTDGAGTSKKDKGHKTKSKS